VSPTDPDRVTALAIASILTVLGVLASAVTGFLGGLLGALFGASAPESAVPFLVVLVVAFAEAGYALTGYAFHRWSETDIQVPWAPGGPTANDTVVVAAATAVLVGVNRLSFAVADRFGIAPAPQVSTPETFGVGLFVLLVPVLLFVVAPAEEYLFRGTIQRYLGRSFSMRGAVGAAALLFTLVHLPNLVSNPAAAPVSIPLWFVLGLAFGWLYERTDRLLVPAAVHGLYNVVVLGFLLR